MTAENTISSEELAKDKYLLELIFNNYYEQERRFQTLESKISSMISFIGVIFTIQSTLFTSILVQLLSAQLFTKVILSLFLIVSLMFYVYALYLFVEAYNFGKYRSAPNPHDLYEKSKENIDESKIYVTGNTAIDAMSTTVDENYTHPELEWIKPGERMILLTAHRRENLGEPMRHIFRGIKRIVDEFDDVKVIYPIHMNPRVREVANEVFGDADRVKLIEPLEVFDFHNFQNKSYIILTDSGGIQEEAPSLGKPVLVLRDTTERPEGIAAGTLKLVGTDEKVIYEETKKLLTNKEAYEKMSKASNPYGDGHASERIVDAIEKYFNK